MSNPTDDSTPDGDAPPDSHEEEERSGGTTRVAVTALACLACFALAMWAMRSLTAGATVIVEADEVATVLMKTSGLKLHQVDGPMVLLLHPGPNSVPAGKFRVEADIQGARLEFSTGEQFEIKKDAVITMVIESVPDE
jgi:hypothetical protein